MKDWWWGRSCSVDLHECDHELLKDPEAIKKFVHELCKVLKMKRHGPTLIERFGHKELRGWSMMQFIETSSITAHFDEKENRVFIDIFSCKRYDAAKVVHFCKKYFKAKKAGMHTLERF